MLERNPRSGDSWSILVLTKSKAMSTCVNPVKHTWRCLPRKSANKHFPVGMHKHRFVKNSIFSYLPFEWFGGIRSVALFRLAIFIIFGILKLTKRESDNGHRSACSLNQIRFSSTRLLFSISDSVHQNIVQRRGRRIDITKIIIR